MFPDFQKEVFKWLNRCFPSTIACNPQERNHRFLEEALELVQACECTKEQAHDLVDYVFNRPVGEMHQEVGGVMVTLASLCSVQTLSMVGEGQRELKRILQPAVQAKIIEKQKTKPELY